MQIFGSGTVQKALLALYALFLLHTAAFARADEKAPQPFDIGPQALSTALTAFARQSREEILFAPGVVASKRTAGVKGTMKATVALKILLKDTGLPFNSTPSGAILVGDPPSKTPQSAISGASASDDPRAQEAGKNSSRDFRVAQVDQAPAGPQVAGGGLSPKDEKRAQLEEVLVTGSRLKLPTNEGPQEVRVYSRETVLESGQTTVADFLNTLPEVSVATGENGLQTKNGGTTVQLHGLPIGTTLVLINGRRVQTSGSQAADDFFDLNNIPLAAVDRIEVLGDGASAIYGSDAIAGVVNIVLRRDFTGLEVAGGYGSAADTSEWNTSVSAGKHWERGSLSLLGSFQSRSELEATERRLTASNDYTPYGGPNNNYPVCNPGNVFSVDGITPLPGLGTATYAAVPAGYRGAPSIEEFRNTAGTLNTCSLVGTDSIIPATRRAGALLQGDYELTPAVTLFTELLYSHTREDTFGPQPSLFGIPFFQSYTVPASNPFNPFGAPVGVAELFTSLPRMGVVSETDFFRPLVGAKGRLFQRFDWEASAFESSDSTRNHNIQGYEDSAAIQGALDSADPATALNPFVAGAPAAQSLLQSFYSDRLAEKVIGRDVEATGFIRGPIAQLPAGALQLVVGAEYARETLYSDEVDNGLDPPDTRATFRRRRAAAFAEARIPLWGPRSGERVERLALTLAGRYDDYSDFGNRTTPQAGIEWRPFSAILLRGSYAKAFKAPPLYDLYAPQSVNTNFFVKDPATGNTEQVSVVSGGNPNLQPETGATRTIGFVYADGAVPDLKLSVTYWSISEQNAIQGNIQPLVIVQNESLFPGSVVRASVCANGPPCPIISVNDTFLNFGSIDVKGFDYQLSYQHQTRFGVWSPALAVTQTYHYSASLAPGSPAVDAVSVAQDSGDWAPRWKGAASLGWQLGTLSTKITGRYVGHYQDYDSTQELGNVWLFDLNARYSTDRMRLPGLKSTYVEVGAVNLFNRAPQFSNYGAAFLGYDPAQADIRGRFIYVHIGAAL